MSTARLTLQTLQTSAVIGVGVQFQFRDLQADLFLDMQLALTLNLVTASHLQR